MTVRMVQAFIVNALLFFGIIQQTVQSATLDKVRQHGHVTCGTTTGLAGFSVPDNHGVWRGLDVDLCRATAAAVLGDANKIKIVPLDAQQRFIALQSGEIDILLRNTSITQQRDTALGVIHAGINFYDGQGFMVHGGRNLKNTPKSAHELQGAAICLQAGTSNENTLADWARANHITYKPVVAEKFDEIVKAFVAGRCDAFSTDMSGLASIRANWLPNPSDYTILPEVISKEPLGPLVRRGDDNWLNIVFWTLSAMIAAEEYGVTSANVDTQRELSTNPVVQRMLGAIPGSGKNMGITDQWAYNIIKQVGNYGESFERNVGQGSPLKLPRGLNAQWKKGGLMYALPIR